MTTPIWFDSYPRDVPQQIDPDRYPSIVAAFESACERFADRPCFTNMGVTLDYADVERSSAQFAAFLQHGLGLKKGDRIGLQMPNVLQYPVALFGALRAGLSVVNTNPLYSRREMEHQYRDSGVRAVVILANFADKLADIHESIGRPRVIVTQLGDLFPLPKRLIVNAALKYVKKLVPKFQIRDSLTFLEALRMGAGQPGFERVPLTGEDLAFIQYTGGTTGVAKGALLTHRNIVANVEQAAAWMRPRFVEGRELLLTPLPLYHIFSLTVNCLVFMQYGAENVLVTNPRDLPALVKLLQSRAFTAITAVSTLLRGLLNQPELSRVDFSKVKFTVAGAMALQRSVAEDWAERTGSPVIEGYGLTEASPAVCCNPVDGTDRLGTIGLPFPSTEIRLVGEDGQDVALGEPGELWVRGPQVMRGYHERPEDTAATLRDGWLCTGDIALMEADGFVRIVDRKKDMIVVSGFNVYPNEVEDVVASHPGVAEVGAIGVPDEKSGEVVKVVVVKKNPALTEQALIAYCRDQLAAYKVPKQVEFRAELPKSPVGKVLRRKL